MRTRAGYEYVRKEERSFSGQTVVPDQVIFRDSCIATCNVGYGGDDADDPPTVQEELSLPKTVICLPSHILRELSIRKNTYFSLVKGECLEPLFAF
jgi:hypothetical protein